MAKPHADVYLADEWVWNGLGPSGRPGGADRPPQPTQRQEADLVVPYVGMNQSWSETVGKVIAELKARQLIARLYLMGHGAAGEITVGSRLRWDDDRSIAEFRRLRPSAAAYLTNVYLVGCEAAADGPCVPQTLRLGESGAVKTLPGVCLGQFSGSTSKPWYQLLRKLADAIVAPVSGSTWKLAIGDGWKLGAAHLTVGPGGGWCYRAINEQGARFGSP
jgi:hypothetical protein